MKFSLATLKEYLDTSATLSEISSTLTRIGLEVENIEDKSAILGQFSVGKILEAHHPENSNKLKICIVEVLDTQSQQTKNLQIVCGAPNARAGIKVAYAPIDSIIPSNSMQIKKAKIAGIESNGMLCSARELNLGNEDAGIIEINDKFAIGTKISEVYGVDDAIIEVNITPNRGDCLGIVGIARDLSATGIGTLKKPAINKIQATFKHDLTIINKAQTDCQFIALRILKNLKNCQSPTWLVEKLNGAGINSISAIVDVTNYVMHVLNRPMHAYDLKQIAGNDIIIQKNSTPVEFISLKNTNHQIGQDILTISDNQKILSIAGVIGSQDSSCSLETQNILLESAYFSKDAVAFSGRNLNIITDARSRFERGVDYTNCIDGIELATQLIIEICGGEASEIIIDNSTNSSSIVNFDFSKFSKITGIEIDKKIAYQILEKLDFKVLSDNQIEVPSHRHDIASSEDLVEEILRIYGYNQISNIDLPHATQYSKNTNIHHKATLLLASRGMTETINWSFVDKNLLKNFSAINDKLIIKNPISLELNYMRPNLAIGLIKSYQKNYLRDFRDIAFFEIGNIFDSEKSQKLMLSGLRAGKYRAQNHFHDEREVDFYDVKKDFFEIIDLYNIKAESLQISSDNPPQYYHPHRFAVAKLGKNIIGYFGEVHPNINKVFDIKTRLYLFEIYVDNLPIPNKNILRKSFQVNDLPIVERDFAFIVDRDLMIGEMIKNIYNIDKNLIKDVSIFDIYHGEKISQDKKSVALRVKIIPIEKTLTSSEIDEISVKIIKSLSDKFNAKLRDN